MKKLFQAGGVRTELVFISSCSSEMSGKAFVEAGVPHVVAVKREESVTGEWVVLSGVAADACSFCFGFAVERRAMAYFCVLCCCSCPPH